MDKGLVVGAHSQCGGGTRKRRPKPAGSNRADRLPVALISATISL
jgi:hypothetical protein